MIWRMPIIAIAVIGVMTLSPVKLTAQEVKLIGSGASFPFPIYSAWFKDFSKQNNGVTVDYQAKGSGAGIPLTRFGSTSSMRPYARASSAVM